MTWDDEAAMRSPEGARSATAGRGWLVVAAMVLALGLVAWYMVTRVQGPLMPLATVRFKGDLAHVSEDALREAVAPHARSGWLGLDVTAVRADVEALPWVKAVAIRRVWPDVLRLTITEHEPLARWGDGSLVSREGAVFRSSRRPAELPALAGPEGTADRVVRAYTNLSKRLGEVGLALTSLTLDARRSWHARLASGTRIAIGRAHRQARIERLVAAWPRLEARGGRPERIDLRYPNGFAIRWSSDRADDTQSPGGAKR